MAKKDVTLQEFIKKAQNKLENRKLIAEIEVNSLNCKLTFARPSQDELLDYISQITKSVKTDKDGNIIDTDFKGMYEASKMLIYTNCAYLKNQELHEALDVKDPLEVISIIFEPEEVVDIAQKIYDVFADKKINETIKN